MEYLIRAHVMGSMFACSTNAALFTSLCVDSILNLNVNLPQWLRHNSVCIACIFNVVHKLFYMFYTGS